jgi:NADH:ubiquinone oxidoreductase subunit 6 (subunit J)
MKDGGCNSAFNAQGLTVIIVVVQVGAVKICVAAVEALRKKERQDETQFTTKIAIYAPNRRTLWITLSYLSKVHTHTHTH